MTKSLRDYSNIPPVLMEALEAYVKTGRPQGDFMRSVITNDLGKAVAHADTDSQYALVALAIWLYNRAPSVCWGSNDKYESWIGHRGEAGWNIPT